MPDALPLTGLFGKVPAHGDFVRRGLPTSFVAPWDAWLQQGMEAARDRLGPRWADVWDSAPPWRFALPAGACGPDAVVGVMLPSQDMVGRRFPITLAALVKPEASTPAPAWFAALEAAASAGRSGQVDADALAAAIPDPGADVPEAHRGAALQQPSDPLPLESSEADPLDMFGREQPLAPAEAPSEFLSAVAGVPGPVIEPSTDGMTASPDPLGIIAAASPDQAPVAPSEDQDLLAIFADAVPQGSASPPEDLPKADMCEPRGELPPYPSMATPAAPDPVPSDGTLAFLLGESAGPGAEPSTLAAAPEDGAALLPGGAAGAPDDTADQSDPLAALIAAGETPLRAAVAMDDASVFAPQIPMDSNPMPASRPTFEVLPAAEAPAAPPGGGWWTGGGGRLPPSVRPVPALLPTFDFASLLEADA